MPNAPGASQLFTKKWGGLKSKPARPAFENHPSLQPKLRHQLTRDATTAKFAVCQRPIGNL
jgi:hypothetical protein